ncbi:MAG: UDP-3-O-(3-hydroxymyristoyl)glucosamine N-acyltransferase, partial [Alphaproteobacteria bacterium]
MADPRFFDAFGPFSLDQITLHIGATCAEGVDGSTLVHDVAALSEAANGNLSFYQSPKYLPDLEATKASVCIMRPRDADKAPANMAVLLSDNPHMAYAKAVQLFYPEPSIAPGISPAAHIDPTATLEADVAIAPGVVIGAGVSIGAGTQIGANTVIERNVSIGRQCRIAPLVTISHALIGNKVTLHTGVRIGQPGFGFAIDMAGHVMLPQLGRVIIQDGANIGANSCVDRGAGEDTTIGEGA